MQQTLDPKKYSYDITEKEAQTYWENNHCFSATLDTNKEKYYCLAMFPYPSGKLHMGHVRNYTISDVIARFQRMLGKNVIQPMGWDAFGLPAENAAIKNQVAPHNWTLSNIEYMKNQLKTLGFAYDWEREVATCDPNYYKWEQWFFIKLYEKGLIYKKNAEVNWDPIDQTVLANEQVIDGRGWRSGALVEKRSIPQWFLKITDYAEELLTSLDTLEEWPEQVKTMQKNWIGKSIGTQIDFSIDQSNLSAADFEALPATLTVFTTRADTLYGATYLAVAAQHPIARHASETDEDIKAFIETCNTLKTAESEIAKLEKKGVKTPFFAIHPLTGEPLPIWIANFVLMSYGSGAVMSVPAHDQRDWEFASKYGIPIKEVITPNEDENSDITSAAFTSMGRLINSDAFNGQSSEEAKINITEKLESLGVGKKEVNFRLRDWGVSRQRYWGTPIPMINCNQCGSVPVPESDLPVVLPTDIQYTADGGSPIKKMDSFSKTNCPKCGESAVRETDTFDTFMESSWYYARFCCPKEADAMVNSETNYWCPVDQYVGGIEHAILHLLYARFFHKLLRDSGLVNSDEPFKRLLCQGMVIAETYFQEDSQGKKTYFSPSEVTLNKDSKGRVTDAVLTETQEPVTIGGIEKMSKSKNNGTDPQSLIDQFGADTVRLFIMFASPPDQSLEWSDAGVEGAHRFLKRLWRTTLELLDGHQTEPLNPSQFDSASLNEQQKNLRRKTHTTIKKVRDDYGRRQTFNTAIAATMELLNEIQQLPTLDSSGSNTNRLIKFEAIESILLLLNPIVPHISHCLWFALGHKTPIIDEPWPKVDEAACTLSSMKLVIQVNGKVRAQLEVDKNTDKGTIEGLALQQENIRKFTGDKSIKKIIYVPGKLLNIVAK